MTRPRLRHPVAPPVSLFRARSTSGRSLVFNFFALAMASCWVKKGAGPFGSFRAYSEPLAVGLFDEIVLRPVSPLVNNVNNEGPEILEDLS
jgi:hypothetical protein